MENEFYLRDTRSDVGSTCMFWAKDGRGYVSDLDKAEVFTREEAQKYADRQNHFIPLSKTKVDALTTVRVDMQYLKLNTDFSKGVIVHRHCGQYDGNDIFFDDGVGGYTADYSKAKIYESTVALCQLQNQSGAALSKAFLDTICRRTLQAENVNHRKMITAAGIKYRAPRKRATTGKTRGNCPECGKITWDYNPYENAYCSEHAPIY
ncbi:hypothetical protein [Pontibacterium sp.]|uniref:hypothetical protein n=1 Tax=Pontibacterium sp. TaxID=2036026 RepID=UPI0035671A36